MAYSPEQEKWILKYLMSRLTQCWGWWPERRYVLDRARRGPAHWECSECGRICTQSEREVDHIVARGPRPKSLAEFLPYVERTLCDRTNLRVLCKATCHRKKTASDAKARAKKRREG